MWRAGHVSMGNGDEGIPAFGTKSFRLEGFPSSQDNLENVLTVMSSPSSSRSFLFQNKPSHSFDSLSFDGHSLIFFLSDSSASCCSFAPS